MRDDVVGLFWDDTPAPKKVKDVGRRQPPERIWERPDYLPGLEEAARMDVPLFTDAELMQAAAAREPLLFDVEVYPNYFLVSFMSFVSGKVAYFEFNDEWDFELDIPKLQWIVDNFCLVGFNSIPYDIHILTLALAGKTNAELMQATMMIINQNERGEDVLKQFRVRRLKVDHIDLIEVAPLRANLKIYGGRLHTPEMQDLPFPVGIRLSADQITILRLYNMKDLVSTGFVLKGLEEQIQLRQRLSAEYGVDLRSKSDAQIAEAVISRQIEALSGYRPKRPEVQYGAIYKYEAPAFLQYRSELLQHVLAVTTGADFVVGAEGGGNIGLPKAISELKFTINRTTYQMGIGGLHSNEKSAVHVSNDYNTIYDRDVTSYYPQLILNSGMYPPQLGTNFLRVYQGIVTRRVEAKTRGDKVTADSLKITANGTFGKLGSPFSVLYAPNLLIQVTLTGQLSLLMLIERLEYADIPVVSANTDGIVILCPNSCKADYLAIVAQWEKDTGLTTEEAVYKLIASRDVNNYMAVTMDGKVKAKGAYLNPWNDKKLAIFRFHKNPTNFICADACEQYLAKGTPPRQTIEACKDIRRFVTVRAVRGGAVKVWTREELPPHNSREELIRSLGYTEMLPDFWVGNGITDRAGMTTQGAYERSMEYYKKPAKIEYLGKSIRWYYAKDIPGEIVYAMNGNKVPRTDGAKPCMTLPDALPDDLDLDWYEAEACGMLAALGVPGFVAREDAEAGDA